MLLSAGLCPAWQRIVVLDALRPGAKNQAREVHEIASGKPVNVGVALHCLGAKCHVLVPLGGATGDRFYQELTGLGVRCRFVRTSAATRICTTVVDRDSLTELVEPTTSLSAAEVGSFVDAHRRTAREARVAVFSGPLPRDVATDFYAELLGSTPCPAVVDASGDALLRTLGLRPLVITPSLEDLEDTLGEPLRDETRLVRALRDLERRGARWLAVTRRTDDLVLVGEGNAWRLRSPSAFNVANSAGFADCLVAGIALGVEQGMRVVDATRFGLGATADNAATLLPARVDPARVSDLADAVEVEPWRPWHGSQPAEHAPTQN